MRRLFWLDWTRRKPSICRSGLSNGPARVIWIWEKHFCRWVSTFYNGAYMRIIINDRLSDEVPLRRGVQQGDPLSPMLYILCVEVLANLIRKSNDVKGFLLPGLKVDIRRSANMQTIQPLSLKTIFPLLRFSISLQFTRKALGPN